MTTRKQQEIADFVDQSMEAWAADAVALAAQLEAKGCTVLILGHKGHEPLETIYFLHLSAKSHNRLFRL